MGIPSASISDTWLFTYGSLMWSPSFEFEERHMAKLFGWHRAMCILSHIYRGTPEKPGLVLGLDRGGQCTGRAYRIAENRWEETKRQLDKRELVNDVYNARWLQIHLPDGGKVKAYAYVAARNNPQYWSGPLLETARLIRGAKGLNGTSYDYLKNTINDLFANGVQDHSLNSIIQKVESLSTDSLPSSGCSGEDC